MKDRAVEEEKKEVVPDVPGTSTLSTYRVREPVMVLWLRVTGTRRGPIRHVLVTGPLNTDTMLAWDMPKMGFEG